MIWCSLLQKLIHRVFTRKASRNSIEIPRFVYPLVIVSHISNGDVVVTNIQLKVKVRIVIKKKNKKDLTRGVFYSDI